MKIPAKVLVAVIFAAAIVRAQSAPQLNLMRKQFQNMLVSPSGQCSRDGRVCAVVMQSNDLVSMVDRATGLTIRRIPIDFSFQGGPAMALSDDGGIFAAGDTLPGKMFDVWDVASGRLLFRRSRGFTEFAGGGAVSLAFSRDAKSLAVLMAAGNAEIWDATDWRILDTVGGFKAPGRVDFSDGRELFVYFPDGTAQTWTRGSPAITSAPGRGAVQTQLPKAEGLAQSDGFSAHFELTADDKLVLPGHPGRVFDLRRGTLKQVPPIGEAGVDTLAENFSVANAGWIGASDYGRCYFLDPVSLKPVPGRTRPCTAGIAISRDGKLAALKRGTKVAIVNTADNTEREFDLGYAFNRLWFSADAGLLLTSGDSGIRAVDVAGGKPVMIAALGENDAISDDLKYALQVRGTESFVRILDGKSGRGIYELPVNAQLRAARFSADGRLLALPLNSGVIAVIDTATGRRAAVLCGFTDSLIDRTRFTADSKRLIASDFDGFIRVWDIASQSEMMTLSLQSMNWAAFTPGGSYDGNASELTNYYWVRGTEIVPLESAAKDRRVTGLAASIWGGHAPKEDGATSSGLSSPPLPVLVPAATPGANGVAFRLRSAPAGTIKVFATRNGVPVSVSASTGGVYTAQVALVNGNNRIVAWAQDSFGRNSAEVVVTRTFKEPASTRPEIVTQVAQNNFQRVALSNDGALMATASGHVITLWDTRTRRQLRTILDHSEAVSGLEFASGGLLVSAAGDGTVRVWNTGTAVETCRIAAISNSSAPSFAVSPDGERIAVGEARLARVFRTADCVEESSFDTGYAAPMWTGSRRLAVQGAGNERNVVRMIDVESGAETRIQTQGDFRSLAAMPDGRALVLLNDGNVQPSGLPLKSGDKVQRIVATRSGRLLVDTGKVQTLFAADLKTVERTWNDGYLAAAAVSADERWIVFSNTLGELRVYNRESAPKIDFPMQAGFGAVTQLRFSKTGDVLVSGYGSISLFGQMLVTPPGSTRLAFWDLTTVSVMRSLGPLQQQGQIEPSANWFLATGLTRIGLVNGQFTTMGLDFKTERAQDGQLRVAALTPDQAHAGTVALPAPEEQKPLMLSGWRLSDSGTVLAMQGRRDGEVRIVDAAGSRDIARFQAHPVQLKAVAVSDDGGLVLTAGDGVDGDSVRLWKRDGTSIWRIENQSAAVLAFSEDQHYVAAAASGEIRVFDAANGALRKSFAMEPATPTALAFSPDNRRLAVGTSDGLVHVYNLGAGDRIVTLMARNDGALAYTPDAYYAGSLARSLALSYRIGTHVYPLQQFDLRFNRPDILTSRMAPELGSVISAYKTAYERRLKEAGVTEAVLQADNELPELQVTAPATASVDKREYSLALTARAKGRIPLDHIEVRVNGVAEPSIGARGRDAMSAAVPIVLSFGSNVIEVSAVDSLRRRSLTEQLNITSTAHTMRTLYVATVGISQYQDQKMELRFAAKDAGDLATYFRDRGAGEFDRIVVADPVTDAGATREGILKLREFFARADVDDTAVLFFAGHGLLDAKLDFYFAPHDMAFASPALRGISMDAMELLLSSSHSRRRLLLVDACHSGEVDKAGSVANREPGAAPGSRRGVAVEKPVGETNAFELERSMFLDLRANTGTEIIAASRGSESAYEGDNLSNGFFTRAILDGLSGGAADKNGDGHVSVSELADFVTAKVQDLSHGLQTPTRRQDNPEQDYLLE